VTLPPFDYRLQKIYHIADSMRAESARSQLLLNELPAFQAEPVS
jgi:hypothetical protein